MNLSDTDPQIALLVAQEEKRQQETISLIPSENYASQAVREAVGSVLTNKYSEGYPGKRYYQGNRYIDEIELLAIERAKKIFQVPYANVQAYSGSPANAAIYFALIEQGDTIMGLKLSAGGHLTHGHPKVTFSGSFFLSVQFDVAESGLMDMDEIEKQVMEHQPKLLMVGTTAYPRLIDWSRFRQIADRVGAWLVADVSHLSGLLAAKVIPSPVPFADVVMLTTHKSLRGPRGALILATEKGLARDLKLGEKIDKAIMPGLQGGPHNNVTAGIAVALQESQTPQFHDYAQRILDNAQVIASALLARGYSLTTGGTDTHLLVCDFRPQGLAGTVVAEALEVAGIVVNSNTVPHDPNPPRFPSGIRLGTPAMTARGMGETEVKQIVAWIEQVVQLVKQYQLPTNPAERISWLTDFRLKVNQNPDLLAINTQVQALATRFPIDA